MNSSPLSALKVWGTVFVIVESFGWITGQKLICNNFTISKEKWVSYIRENTEFLKLNIIYYCYLGP